eukprot:CAMPEP_0184873158 /NCGR_PEP_ID=MMETSP0580-20130426/41684_1 /TAXON_ID=1118495 /ORGANISM="Dactyliosolen fragilissimus" /LENGTH=210 /DNA_ID=CAMNT_0027376027 /DNA_START=458 /DNA_END=1090 /DNA_ORIENTATION=+
MIKHESEEDESTKTENEDDDQYHHFYNLDDALPGERETTARQIQYSLKRAQCTELMGQEHYSQLVDELTTLAAQVGLTAITPPWISLYLNGDEQNFHTDAPHGPLAFVFSLCRHDDIHHTSSSSTTSTTSGQLLLPKDFEGGETMMLRRNILDYWRGYDGSKGLECPSIVRFIPPTPLGRCIAFDPRVPHGVNKVVGSNDPRKGRIVIHG